MLSFLREAVGEVNDFGLRRDARDDTLHRADKPVLRAEIRGQSNDAHGSDCILKRWTGE
jgi:hypothetical protein